MQIEKEELMQILQTKMLNQALKSRRTTRKWSMKIIEED